MSYEVQICFEVPTLGAKKYYYCRHEHADYLEAERCGFGAGDVTRKIVDQDGREASALSLARASARH